MTFWILVITYWLHLLATIVWLGGLALFVLIAWPLWRQGTIVNNQWWAWQQRFIPLANGSLVILLLTGFYQMTQDPNYNGFLAIDSVWATAMLIKHLAFVIMVGLTAYTQAVVHPALRRLQLLQQQKPTVAQQQQTALITREQNLLRFNLSAAIIVLLCTAVATAV
ncbi:MAG TPA: CopD family protein [Anaerolineae bacterium]|nr:CopD family protein [Anaerolineae bacterium]